jgi:hypothetical protein
VSAALIDERFTRTIKSNMPPMPSHWLHWRQGQDNLSENTSFPAIGEESRKTDEALFNSSNLAPFQK